MFSSAQVGNSKIAPVADSGAFKKQKRPNKSQRKAFSANANAFKQAYDAARLKEQVSTEAKLNETAAAAAAASLSTDTKTAIVSPVKSKETTLPISTVKIMLSGGNGGKGLSPFKGWLWFVSTNTSAATTAQAPVINLTPASSAEFNSGVDLYDEFKVHEVQAKFYTQFSGASTGVDLIVGYDPADATAYGSVTAALPTRYNTGPIRASGSNSGGVTIWGKHGMITFKAKMPPGTLNDPTTASNCNTGNWTSCSTVNIASINYGYLKTFITAPSTGTSTIQLYVGLFTEFRMRS